MSKDTRLSDQQFQIVQAVSRLGEASAKDVMQALAHLSLAHTTIATVLTRLERRGILASSVQGRERFYRNLVDESTIRRSMVSSLVTTLFKGDSAALMAHLVSEGEVKADELDALRLLIDQGDEND